MAVVSALQTYRPKGLSFRAFVYGIAAHKVTDAFRASGRDRTEPVAEPPDTLVTAEGPEHRVLDAERDAALRALLAHLTPRQREVLVLRLAVGVSAERDGRGHRLDAGGGAGNPTPRAAPVAADHRARSVDRYGGRDLDAGDAAPG